MPPLPTPRELQQWEAHPVTLAYLRLLQWQVYDGVRIAQNEIELAHARGLEQAFDLQVALRDKILKGGEEEEDGEGSTEGTDR
jgi:hypothetical protein